MSTVRVVEKFYSAQELAGLIGFNTEVRQPRASGVAWSVRFKDQNNP